MLPTFHVVGDQMITDKRYKLGRGIRVGDIISFNSVYEPGGKVIKRVIGLEGDYVMRDTPEAGSTAMIQVSAGSTDIGSVVELTDWYRFLEVIVGLWETT